MAKADFLDISFLGDKKLQKKLKRIDIKMQRKYVRQSIRRAMAPVKTKAKTLAPVDRGRLKASIKIRSKTRRGISRVTVETVRREELGIEPNAKWYYPAAIEYGYRRHGIFYPARSFMRRALTETRHRVIKQTADHIAGYLRSESRK